MLKEISTILQQAIKKAFPELPETPLELTPATQGKWGHYQLNSAMKIAKIVGKNPRDVASAITQAISDPTQIFQEVTIAGPGFINLTLSNLYLSDQLNLALRDPHLGVSLPPPQTILVEFSSPNIAKEMHVGHLRSTIIGDAIARLFEFLGHIVIRVNHVGDWGTQFGMLIAYMHGFKKEANDLPTLMQYYKESKKLFDEDDDFKTRARGYVVALQRGKDDVIEEWRRICDISRRGYKEVYDLLDVSISERGESFYNPMLKEVVEELEEKGLVTVSQGAKCVFHEGYSIPLMVQKSDGGYNYDTTDMAAMKYRVETEKADRIIVITDSGQSLHFKLVYETAVKAHYLDPKKVRFDHVTFGVVLGPDGKKFKTRSGETEKLIDLIHEAIKEAKSLLKERGQEDDNIAQVLGVDAIKYADLSCNRINDYLFSYERMLKFEGNTATFILYSFVRVNGIKRKIPNLDMEKLIREQKIALKHPSEIDLGLHLLKFSEVLEVFANELLPNLLTDYLYVLANKFNAFFRDCQVIGTEEETSRLLLCECTSKILATGLNILGLKTLEKM